MWDISVGYIFGYFCGIYFWIFLWDVFVGYFCVDSSLSDPFTVRHRQFLRGSNQCLLQNTFQCVPFRCYRYAGRRDQEGVPQTLTQISPRQEPQRPACCENVQPHRTSVMTITNYEGPQILIKGHNYLYRAIALVTDHTAVPTVTGRTILTVSSYGPAWEGCGAVISSSGARLSSYGLH